MPIWRKSLRLKYGRLPHTSVLIPQLTVHVRSPQQERLRRSVPAVIDTGADRTCIPRSVFAKLGELNFEYGEVGVQGAVGMVEKKQTFVVHLEFAKCDFLDLEVIALEEDFALIGRDLLNLHKILLNGPESEFRIHRVC